MTAHLSEELLNLYADGTLAEAGRREVEAHLTACEACRAEAARLRALLGAVRELPRSITPPRDLWPGIASQLGRTRRPAWLWVPLAAAASVALVFLGRAVLAPPGWPVSRAAGAPLVGARVLRETGSLRVGQWVLTDDTSRAVIQVGEIGQVEVRPGTRIQLAAARPTDHRLALARGAVRARVSAPPRLFVVETPSAVAIDLGCAYALEVDSAGNGFIHVTGGLVELRWGDRTSIVPVFARAPLRHGFGPGVPYVEDAPPAFREALAAFEFEPGSGEPAALRAVLQAARPADGLSLWHLLQRVPAEWRGDVYDRLAALVPPPGGEGVTREAVLALDRTALDTYWNYIPGTVWRPEWRAVP